MSAVRVIQGEPSYGTQDTMDRQSVHTTAQRPLIPSEFLLARARSGVSSDAYLNGIGASSIGSQHSEPSQTKSAELTGYDGAIGAPWIRSLPGPADITKLIAPRRSPSPLFFPRQEWEGVVEAVEKDQIRARLYTILGDSPDEGPLYAEIPNEEIADADRKVMRPGSIFRWSIGYKRIGATKERVSVLVFRQLPQWTAASMTRADEIARGMAALFDEEI